MLIFNEEFEVFALKLRFMDKFSGYFQGLVFR
jgi:hypothetical protein